VAANTPVPTAAAPVPTETATALPAAATLETPIVEQEALAEINAISTTVVVLTPDDRLSGTAPAGTTLALRIANGPTLTVTASADGSWAMVNPVFTGMLTVEVGLVTTTTVPGVTVSVSSGEGATPGLADGPTAEEKPDAMPLSGGESAPPIVWLVLGGVLLLVLGLVGADAAARRKSATAK